MKRVNQVKWNDLKSMPAAGSYLIYFNPKLFSTSHGQKYRYGVGESDGEQWVYPIYLKWPYTKGFWTTLPNPPRVEVEIVESSCQPKGRRFLEMRQ